MKAVLFIDVDGTLTVNRSSTQIDHRVLVHLKNLEEMGYLVVLTSGNSLPVVRGLSIYFGLKGMVIAENGAVVFTDKLKFACGGCSTAREALQFIVANLSDYVRSSWQNTFRLCDFAFKLRADRGSEGRVLEVVMSELRKAGYLDKVEILNSGYAYHLHPKGCGKDRGISCFLREAGIPEEVPKICVGDSATDVPMKKVCDLLVAVSNSDEELKKVADVVLEKPSAEGFIEFTTILDNLLRELVSRGR